MKLSLSWYRPTSTGVAAPPACRFFSYGAAIHSWSDSAADAGAARPASRIPAVAKAPAPKRTKGWTETGLMALQCLDT
ncbi:hypothetical protein SCALM49S_10248 [Streptomyces californicus]